LQGSWFSDVADVAGEYFKSRRQAPVAAPWQPYEAPQNYTVGADGGIIYRGLPSAFSAPQSSGLQSVLPLALIAGIVYLAWRALK
jgi:hypothetical protein